MKTKNILITSATAFTFLLSTATMSLAHSGHDHSRLPLKWTFAQNTSEKIGIVLAGQSENFIGLSKFEQKKLNRYGIKIGNTFSSVVSGEPVQVQRINSGLKVAKTSHQNIASTWEIPLRRTHKVILASTGASHDHLGHNHAQLPYEWEFSSATVNHIKNRISPDSNGGFVGLNHFEQKMLDRYGIKVGHKFHSIVDGAEVIVERTSGGIRVVQANENVKLASAIVSAGM